MFVYENGYESREYHVTCGRLRGIRISPNVIVSAEMFSTHYPEREAAVRGLLLRDSRLEVLHHEDMKIIRCRCAEFNRMLEQCGANFRLPAEGGCWVISDALDDRLKLTDFWTGNPLAGDEGWALYRYLW